jgi:glycerol-3-phosphate dehydrogenase (NAD(P)+)
MWTIDHDFLREFERTREHSKLPDSKAHETLTCTTDLAHALKGAELIVESVTSKGVRPVCEQLRAQGNIHCPMVITSKGIEQNTGLLLPDVVVEVLGEEKRPLVCVLSGPSHAEEVIRKLPTAVICASYDPAVMHQVVEAFTTPYFRIYPNADVNGVAFGGAMKNIIAIACGISDGLGFGDNTKAALMTRGLHEIRKLSVTKGCNPETLNGLSGMGDLCVTCLSTLSRNYMFGRRIAEGLDPQMAQQKIGMVVEGAYSCVSALQLAKQAQIPVPITQAVYSILYEGLNPRDAVKTLLQRAIKEEHL